MTARPAPTAPAAEDSTIVPNQSPEYHLPTHRQPGSTVDTGIAADRRGAGAPLVLLHALGSSRHVWEPVIAALSDHFDVIAVDLPGFGGSPPLPGTVTPTPAALAAAIADALDTTGVRRPHVVGNSLGGWIALELAALRPLASLTLLSPAGLWPRDTPVYCRISLRATRWLTTHLPGLLNRIVNYRFGRILVLGQSHGRPARMSPAQARAAIEAMGSCVGFDATLAATIHRRYTPRAPLDIPVAVAFGSRDRILPRRQWRRTDMLPRDSIVAELPRCGHFPMADDPAAVTRLVARSAARA
jgi:pimeloyl-ACP methyl ester carboxylesterase